MALSEWWNGVYFGWVHGNNLVYNTCWEDPRIDRKALELTPQDSVMVITSAGCNVLDYALESPKEVHAVDMNHRQNALLELKLAGIRHLDFEEFFEMFGRGRLPDARSHYSKRLRTSLSPSARDYWDEHLHFFAGEGRRDSFYFYGTSGYFAWLMNGYLNHRPRLREAITALLNASTLEEQQALYYGEVQAVFWNRFLRWVLGRDVALSLLGVPRAQRKQVERHYDGGIARFIEDCLETVFAYLPMYDNYFWRVYLTGQYTETCCPEYLKRDNFQRLKDGLVDCVHVHTDTIEGFLRSHESPITRFVLLDHMDWLSSHRLSLLESEWQAIVDRAAPQSRIIWRSGGMKVDFVDPILVTLGNESVRVGDILKYNDTLAAELHQQDRVHTYGSFYIADYAAV